MALLLRLTLRCDRRDRTIVPRPIIDNRNSVLSDVALVSMFVVFSVFLKMTLYTKRLLLKIDLDRLCRINPHFPSIVDIQCGEKAILL